MRVGGRWLTVLVVMCAGLTGCSDDDPASAPVEPPASEMLPDFHDNGAAPESSRPPAAELAWDATEQEKVTALAAQTMRLFARPKMSAEQWWTDLEPRLSAQARLDYFGIDPASVPVTKITGPVTLVPMSTKLASIAHIPTDAGLYAVTLSRTPEEPQWVVEQITPPEPDPHGQQGT